MLTRSRSAIPVFRGKENSATPNTSKKPRTTRRKTLDAATTGELKSGIPMLSTRVSRRGRDENAVATNAQQRTKSLGKADLALLQTSVVGKSLRTTKGKARRNTIGSVLKRSVSDSVGLRSRLKKPLATVSFADEVQVLESAAQPAPVQRSSGLTTRVQRTKAAAGATVERGLKRIAARARRRRSSAAATAKQATEQAAKQTTKPKQPTKPKQTATKPKQLTKRKQLPKRSKPKQRPATSTSTTSTTTTSSKLIALGNKPKKQQPNPVRRLRSRLRTDKGLRGKIKARSQAKSERRPIGEDGAPQIKPTKENVRIVLESAKAGAEQLAKEGASKPDTAAFVSVNEWVSAGVRIICEEQQNKKKVAEVIDLLESEEPREVSDDEAPDGVFSADHGAGQIISVIDDPRMIEQLQLNRDPVPVRNGDLVALVKWSVGDDVSDQVVERAVKEYRQRSVPVSSVFADKATVPTSSWTLLWSVMFVSALAFGVAAVVMSHSVYASTAGHQLAATALDWSSRAHTATMHWAAHSVATTTSWAHQAYTAYSPMLWTYSQATGDAIVAATRSWVEFAAEWSQHSTQHAH